MTPLHPFSDLSLRLAANEVDRSADPQFMREPP